MTTNQAKNLPLPEVLLRMGHRPVKAFKQGVELAYFSPFRKEKEPSFFVNTRKNVWYDFGIGGGTAIDFIMQLEGLTVSQSLGFLEKLWKSDFKPVSGRKNIEAEYIDLPPLKTFQIDAIKPFSTSQPTLKHFILQDRKISAKVAQAFLKEIHFTNLNSEKPYFAAGFENLSGGFEIRNPFFKSSLGGKNMSFVRGTNLNSELAVYEGFMDFLSRLTIDKLIFPERDSLILNSASFQKQAFKFIENGGYKFIFGFFDNDTKGEELTKIFEKKFSEKFQDVRFIFEGFNDLNSFLQKNHA